MNDEPRGPLVDAWLVEYQTEHGAFDEDELRTLAAATGVPYAEPGRVNEQQHAKPGPPTVRKAAGFTS